MNKSIVKLFISIGLSCVCFSGHATRPYNDTVNRLSDTYPDSIENIALFATEEPLEMTLCLDIKEFLRTKSHPKYCDAICTIKFNGDSISKKIKIKARGEMRREYCHYPPILLKFSDSEQKVDSFPLQGKLKLVTPCMPTPVYENFVLKEYLVYQLFNHVTPYSLKTRLVKICFTDLKRPGRNYTAFGFLIESEESLAERNGAVIIKNANLSQRNMEPGEMTRVALFNYMVGNTDWSVPLLHNIKVLRPYNLMSNKGIPVAYDFDYTGLVNAVYAAPAEGLPIKEVRERYYLGLCENNDELDKAITEFEDLKEQFISTINDFEYISPIEKKHSEYYINGFYKMYKNQHSMISMLDNTCKN